MAAHGECRRRDEHLRGQVEAARRLLSGSLRAQIRIDDLCKGPGGDILRPILEDAFQDQIKDMHSAQAILQILDVMSQECDLASSSSSSSDEMSQEAGCASRDRGDEGVAAAERRGGRERERERERRLFWLRTGPLQPTTGAVLA